MGLHAEGGLLRVDALNLGFGAGPQLPRLKTGRRPFRIIMSGCQNLRRINKPIKSKPTMISMKAIVMRSITCREPGISNVKCGCLLCRFTWGHIEDCTDTFRSVKRSDT